MTKPYVVQLVGWPDLSPADRIAMEVRYAEAFEAHLGGADKVNAAWAEWLALGEMLDGEDFDQLDECDYSRARQAGKATALAGRALPSDAAFVVETEFAWSAFDIPNSHFDPDGSKSAELRAREEHYRNNPLMQNVTDPAEMAERFAAAERGELLPMKQPAHSPHKTNAPF